MAIEAEMPLALFSTAVTRARLPVAGVECGGRYSHQPDDSGTGE
jgi:hypothetical protein